MCNAEKRWQRCSFLMTMITNIKHKAIEHHACHGRKRLSPDKHMQHASHLLDKDIAKDHKQKWPKPTPASPPETIIEAEGAGREWQSQSQPVERSEAETKQSGLKYLDSKWSKPLVLVAVMLAATTRQSGMRRCFSSKTFISTKSSPASPIASKAVRRTNILFHAFARSRMATRNRTNI